jgi:hypothetical protein
MSVPRPLWDAHGAQKANSTAISLPRGVGSGWNVSEAAEGFVTSVAGGCC